ncbi:MAG: tyrosine-type recombinase/integrase [Isosphaeraceae bacterium]
MPRLVHKTPSSRHHKADGRAIVTIDGRDFYLGRFGSPETRAEYDRLVAEWLVNKRRPAEAVDAARCGATIDEVVLAFWRHAELHYRHRDGSPTGELENFRHSLRPLRKLYGGTPAAEFGPLKLKAVRQGMVDAGLARTTINQRVGRIVHVFKWAASEELVPAGVYQALKTVRGLPKGRSRAREPEPVRPVADEAVEAVRPHVSRQVWAMIELQRMTGMRPGEVVILRTADLDRGGDVWVYTPARHKTQHHGRSRLVPIGPRAQEVLAPWLRPDEPDRHLFSPREAMEEYLARQRRPRKKDEPSAGVRAVNTRLGEHYSTRTYCHAIWYGCRRAGIAAWHPNQLRHSAATRIRRHADLDGARAVLGHSDLRTAEIYAERDLNRAVEVAREIG